MLVMTTVASGDPAPAGVIDERGTERILNVGSFAAALAVGALALLLAITLRPWAFVLLTVGAAWVILWWPALLRTFTLTTSIVIERDPATVFAFWSNCENEPKFWSEVESVNKVTAGPIGPGTRFSARVRLAAWKGREMVFEGTEEILDYQPSTRFTSTVSTALHPNLDVMTFETVPEGTRVTLRFESVRGFTTYLLGGWFRSRPLTEQMRTRRLAAWAKAKQILEVGVASVEADDQPEQDGDQAPASAPVAVEKLDQSGADVLEKEAIKLLTPHGSWFSFPRRTRR
jgi:hypothetical protein